VARVAGGVSVAVGAGLGVVAGAAAACAVLAHGGRFSDRLDLFSHFAPIYLAAALAAALAALAIRTRLRPMTFALAGVAVVASGALIAPEYLRSAGPAAPAEAPGQVKVIQINASQDNADIARIADWVVAQRPDVLTIQEARHDLRDLIYRRTRWRISNRTGDVMIFTPDLRLQMDRKPLPPGSWINYVNATYPSRSGAFEVITTHVSWPTDPRRRRVRDDLFQVVGRLPRERMILTGDFNATPWSFVMRRQEAQLGLVRRDRAIATYPAQVLGHDWPLPVLPIDHVYAGSGWATVKVERGPNLGSDHYPLVITLAPVARR